MPKENRWLGEKQLAAAGCPARSRHDSGEGARPKCGNRRRRRSRRAAIGRSGPIWVEVRSANRLEPSAHIVFPGQDGRARRGSLDGNCFNSSSMAPVSIPDVIHLPRRPMGRHGLSLRCSFLAA
jgi:hypothetical protein